MKIVKARQQIRQALEAGVLPYDFDLTSFGFGCPPNNTPCAGCGEVFLSSYTHAVVLRRSGEEYWFHAHCERLWEEERQAAPRIRLH